MASETEQTINESRPPAVLYPYLPHWAEPGRSEAEAGCGPTSERRV